MRFCCVTPCLNAERHIERTLLSVLGQSMLARSGATLDYTIQDGGSRDGTLALVERLVRQFSGRDNIRIHVVSVADSGMYDALAKGFECSPPCDVYAYLNAGDMYSAGAFDIVAGIFKGYGVHFLTGMNTILNEAGHVVDTLLPPRYCRSLLEQGAYGTLLPCVQQESTFWSGKLQAAVDLDRLRKYRYAGDFFLWQSFARQAPLEVVSAWLGGFCVHEGQLSAVHLKDYLAEARRTIPRIPTVAYMGARAEKLLWHLPNKLKRRLNPGMFVFDSASNIYIPAGQLR